MKRFQPFNKEKRQFRKDVIVPIKSPKPIFKLCLLKYEIFLKEVYYV